MDLIKLAARIKKILEGIPPEETQEVLRFVAISIAIEHERSAAIQQKANEEIEEAIDALSDALNEDPSGEDF